MTEYSNFLKMVSSEFHKYLMENEKVAKKIPKDALIIFKIEGEDGFNRWHRKTSLKNREKSQQLVVVHLKGWRSHSSIEEIRLAKIAV